MDRKLSIERLLKLRRLRKARRFWKKEPLFAYLNMKELYENYSMTNSWMT